MSIGTKTERQDSFGTGAELPKVTSIDEVASQSIFSIGSVSAYNMMHRAARASVYQQWQDSHPHIIRVIGSLPGEAVTRKVRATLLKTLSALPVGPIIIGGNESHKASDPGVKVDSIPSIAAALQAYSFTSERFGKVAPVWASTPVHQDLSSINADNLSLLGNSNEQLEVILQQALLNALVYQTLGDDLWEAEANGVVETIDSYLSESSHARYSVLLIGGGEATKLEYERTRDVLVQQYGERVNLIGIQQTGGFTSTLIKQGGQNNLYNIGNSHQLLKQLLRHFNSEIVFPERECAVEDSLVKDLADVKNRVAIRVSPDEEPSDEISNFENQLVKRMQRYSELAQSFGDKVYTLEQAKLKEKKLMRLEREIDGILSSASATPRFLALKRRVSPYVSRSCSVMLEELEAQTLKIRKNILITPDELHEEVRIGDKISTADGLAIYTGVQTLDGSSIECLIYSDTGVEVRNVQIDEPIVIQRGGKILSGDSSFSLQEASGLPPEIKLGDILVYGDFVGICLEGNDSEGQRILRAMGVIESSWEYFDGEIDLDSLELDDLKIYRKSANGVPVEELFPGHEISTIDNLLAEASPLSSMNFGEMFTVEDCVFVTIDRNGKKEALRINGEGAESFTKAQLSGEALESIGSTSERPLRDSSFEAVPDACPTWESLENKGGIIRYISKDGDVLVQEEVLATNQAIDEEGLQLPKGMYRRVDVVRYSFENDKAQVTSEIRHVNSLMFPPSDIPEAVRVEVHSYNGRYTASPSYPEVEARQRILARPQRFNKMLSEVVAYTLNETKEKAANSALARVVELASEMTEQSMESLLGVDSSYEIQLQKNRAHAEKLSNIQDLITAWSAEVALIDIEAEQMLDNFALTNPEADLHEIGQLISRIVEQRPLSAKLTTFGVTISEQINLLGEFEKSEKYVEFGMTCISNENATKELVEELVGIINGKKASVKGTKNGAIATEMYTEAYLWELLNQGATFLCLQNEQERVLGLTIYVPPRAITADETKLTSHLGSDNDALYRVTAPAPDAPHFTTVALLRATVAVAQYDQVDRMHAIIHSENLSSMKGALRDRFLPNGEILVRKATGGKEEKQLVWTMPVDPSLRTVAGLAQPPKKRDAVSQVKVLSDVSSGFRTPTEEERRKFMFIANTNHGLPYVRLSMGVASMTEQSVLDFREIISKGTFDFMNAVVCTASTREAVQSEDGKWALLPRGAHAVLDRLLERSPGAEVVGLATQDIYDRNFGNKIPIEIAPGVTEYFQVVSTNTDDGTAIDIIDPRMCATIDCPVDTKKGPGEDLSIYHIEQFRAEQFGSYFKDQVFMYLAGGGINAWHIKALCERLRANPSLSIKILGITGFGGTTDALSKDNDFIATNRELIESGKLTFINPLESEERRLELRQYLVDSGLV